MIVCVGLTPAVQRVMVFPRLDLDAVNRAVRTLEGVAGKAVNVAKVARALGEEPVVLGFVGGDRGERIRRELDRRGIRHDFLTVPVPTRECVTVIDESNGKQTELVEESQPVAAGDYEQVFAVLQDRVRQAGALVLSGTMTPGGPPDWYARCTAAGLAAGVLTVIDATGDPLIQSLPRRPGLVKPNRSELASTVGRELTEVGDVRSAMTELHERGAERVVVTAGRGATLAFDGRTTWAILSPRVRAVNAIGSGDSFTAAVVWRLMRGDDLGEACRWGAAAGAANALQWMAGEVEPSDVERLTRSVEVERLE